MYHSDVFRLVMHGVQRGVLPRNTMCLCLCVGVMCLRLCVGLCRRGSVHTSPWVRWVQCMSSLRLCRRRGSGIGDGARQHAFYACTHGIVQMRSMRAPTELCRCSLSVNTRNCGALQACAASECHIKPSKHFNVSVSRFAAWRRVL